MRQVIFIFYLFSFIFALATVSLIYLKQGSSSIQLYEYYAGSEAMLALYPDAVDRFISPKTNAGLLKIALPHSFAMFLWIFLLLHVALYMKIIKKIQYLFLAGTVFAILDIASGFLAVPYKVIWPKVIGSVLFNLYLIFIPLLCLLKMVSMKQLLHSLQNIMKPLTGRI